MASHLRAASGSLLPPRVRACCGPRRATCAPRRPSARRASCGHRFCDDHLIRLDSDGASLTPTAWRYCTGHVKVRQDLRTSPPTGSPTTRRPARSPSTDRWTSRTRGSASPANRAPTTSLGGANFDQANFHIFDRNGRGFAKDIEVHPDGKVSSRRCATPPVPPATRTGCCRPPRSSSTPRPSKGVAHQVVMRFKDVPIFYTPYIAFPLGDARQSGLLVPELRPFGQQRLSAGGALLFRSGAELRSRR